VEAIVDTLGGNGRGGYLGPPPQRMGFGRKTMPLHSQRSDSYTLSQASAPPPEAHLASGAIPNDIDFSIGGGDMQFVEIELDPGEVVVAEPGAMIWKDSAIGFDTTLGDGSDQGLGSKLLSAGSNLLSGESLYVAEFRHEGTHGKARLALGGRVPGQIIPVRLDAMGGTLICQRSAFLAAAKGVAISVAFQRKLASAVFGQEGFIMQRLRGEGWAFLHVGGTIIERELGPGELIYVDGGCVAAHEPQVQMDIDERFGLRAIKSAALGGEGLFLTTLRGPGKVWLQTLPFSRVAAEAAAAAPARETASKVGATVGVIEGIDALRKMF
jgi:uncharacterized protein (TIGR00266 family)